MAKKIELTEEIKQRIIQLTEKGCTDKAIYKSLRINHNTFYNWLKDDTEFSETLKMVKRPLNVNVENSLYERANGMKFTEVTKEYVVELGKMIVTKKVTKFIPPDPTSMIYWLNNKDAKNWKSKQEFEHTTAEPLNININYKTKDELKKSPNIEINE